MKKIFIIVLILSSWAKAEILVVSKVNQDRSQLEVTYSNQRTRDMFCPQVHVKIEYCDSNYCDVVGETQTTIDSLYIGANSDSVFTLENSTTRMRKHYPDAIINRVKDLNIIECRPADFKDYCQYANKSVDERHTVGKIMEVLRVEDCDIDNEELKYIKINNSEIRDLKPFSYMTYLENLNLEDNEIEDLSPLYELDNLWSVVVDNNPIRSLEGLLNKKLITRVSAKNIPLDRAINGPYTPTLKYLNLGSQGRLCEVTKTHLLEQYPPIKVLCD